MLEMLYSISEWLTHTGASQGIRNVAWIVPATQSVHILAIAAVMGTIVLIDLRVLGLAAHSQTVGGMVRRLTPALWIALLVLLITGSILVLGEPNRSVVNPAFLFKMFMLAIVVALTLFFIAPVREDENYWSGPGRAAMGKVIAAISIGIWIAIIFAGRWIAYTNPFELG